MNKQIIQKLCEYLDNNKISWRKVNEEIDLITTYNIIKISDYNYVNSICDLLYYQYKNISCYNMVIIFPRIYKQGLLKQICDMYNIKILYVQLLNNNLNISNSYRN